MEEIAGHPPAAVCPYDKSSRAFRRASFAPVAR